MSGSTLSFSEMGLIPALVYSFAGLGQRPPYLSVSWVKAIWPWRAGLNLFLSLSLLFILMGLDCTSLQLMVSWDGSYRWNHSNLTLGDIGQFPLPWTPSLISNIAQSTWAVSQSLKGFLLYRHLCCNGICCDGIWAVWWHFSQRITALSCLHAVSSRHHLLYVATCMRHTLLFCSYVKETHTCILVLSAEYNYWFSQADGRASEMRILEMVSKHGLNHLSKAFK